MRQKIHMISDNDDFIILMNLIGVESTLLDNTNNFIDTFKKLKNDKSISVIIISMKLPETIIEHILEFKLNNTKPFIFLMPNLFEEQAEDKSILLNRIYKQANKLLI